MIVIGIIYVFAAIILIVAIVMGSKKLKNQRYSSDNDILSVYQYSEIVIGTVLFFIIIISSVINGNYNTLDIVYSTLAFGSTFALGKIVGNWVDYNHN